MKRKACTTERREFERYPTNLPVVIVRESAVAGMRSGEFDGYLIDLSRSGVRFTSQELFHRGETVRVLYLGNAEHRGLCIEVKIVRAKRVLGQKYEMAARIAQLLPKDEGLGPVC